MGKQLSVRVYAIFETNYDCVLALRERYQGVELVKFPGGGMLWGESATDTLKRELWEELGMSNFEHELLYIYDKPIISKFNPEISVIPIYYRIISPEDYSIEKHIASSEESSTLIELIPLPLVETSCKSLTFENDRAAFKFYLERFIHC